MRVFSDVLRSDGGENVVEAEKRGIEELERSENTLLLDDRKAVAGGNAN